MKAVEHKRVWIDPATKGLSKSERMIVLRNFLGDVLPIIEKRLREKNT